MLVFVVHPQHHRDRHEVHEDGRAAEAHERQGQALGGQGAEVHAHVDEGLEAHPDRHALRDEAREDAVQGDGLAADVHDAARHPEEQRDHDQHADEAEFLADHGEQEVGVGFGQPVQLFHAAAQADAEDLATAYGDERVRELVALAERVRLAERVEVGEDPLPAPWAAHHHDGEGEHQHGGDEEEHAGVDAAQEQDAHRDDGDHHEGAHVGLGQQQHAHDRHRHAHGQHGAEEALLHFHLAHHVVGRIDQHRELRELGGLEVHDAQGKPAPRAVDHRAHVRHQHRHQQDDGEHEQPGCDALPHGHGHLEGEQRGHEAHPQREDVAHEEVGGRDLAEARVVRHGDGRRIDHDQPPGQQRHHHPEQGLVETEHARRGGRGLAVFRATHAHGQHVGRGRGAAPEPAGHPLAQALWRRCSSARGHASPPSSACPASSAIACTASRNTSARCS